MKKFLIFVMLIMSPAFLPVAAHENESHAGLEISQAWARKTGSRTASAAVYLEVKNTSDEMETLLSVSSARAAMATIHRSIEQDGIMRMEMQEEQEIAPGKTIAFEPGGMHIMLMRLDQPLLQGQLFPVTLTFEHAGDVTVYVEVTGIAGLQK